MKLKWRPPVIWGAFILFAFVCIVVGLCIGSVNIPPLAVIKSVLGAVPGLGFLHDDLKPEYVDIILILRAPVVIMALLTGVGLSSSGAAMQGLFRNPLVDPFIIGISAGGAFGWVIGGVLTAGTTTLLSQSVRITLCFLAGITALGVAYAIARSGSRVPVANLLLAGIATSSVLTSATYLLIYFYVENPSELIFSLMGSCGNSRWREIYIVAPVVVLGSSLLMFFSRDLNAFSTGEESAKHLGVEVEKSKGAILVLSSIIAAVTIPFCGIIGFVGLIVPHIVRRLTGPDHRTLIPLTAVAGGGFVILSDLVARSITESVIPLGIITGFLGGGFFLYLLITRRKVA